MRAGIVLAGGRGSRMGRPKASIELAGRTLAHRAVGMLRAIGCDLVLVVEGGDEGPLAALLEPVSELNVDEVFVLACDLPLAGPVVERLAALSGGPAIAVDEDGRTQPLCSRWPVPALQAFLERAVPAGERRMSALVEELQPALLPASNGELLNVNTPQDLERAVSVVVSAGGSRTSSPSASREPHRPAPGRG